MDPREHEYVLDTTAVPGGDERTLRLTIRPGWTRGPMVEFVERHTGAGSGWLGGVRNFRVTAHLQDVEPLAVLLEARLGSPSRDDDLVDRLVAAFTAAVQRGDLGDGLPPMGARERVAGWLADAGVQHGRYSSLPTVKLAPDLTLRFQLDAGPWQVEVTEYADEHRLFEVTIAYESIDLVIAHLERRFGPIGYEAHPEDRMGRLAAVFTTLSERGHLDGQLPAGARADQVAAWYAEAGVPHRRGGERQHTLLHTYRDNTGCSFELTLGISSREDRIWFAERYDYDARPGDAGREYAYRVKTPYASLDRLVVFFATRLGMAGDGDREDRLLACFTELVTRGDLADTGVLEASRDRVASWFTEAGVPAEPDFWVWLNSD